MTSEELTCYCVSAAEHYKDEWYVNEGVPYQHGGILPSELLLFHALCLKQKIDVVIESGRCNGHSTECLARLGHKIESYEMADDRQTVRYAELGKFRNLTLHVGNSVQLLPRHVKELNGLRMAVLLDGPKGAPAFSLFESIQPRVVFAAFHDVHQFNEGGGANPAFTLLKSQPVHFSTRQAEYNRFQEMDGKAIELCGYSSWNEMTRAGYGLGIVPGGRWR